MRGSLDRVGDFIHDGWNVIIFPEGTRSLDGRPLPLHEGIGLLATSLRAPVVPVHIAGAYGILPKGRALPVRHRGQHVTVTFGAPMRFAAGTSAHEATASIARGMSRLASTPDIVARPSR